MFNSGHGGTGGSACTPKSCVSQGFACGVWSDGCGSTVDCGTCPAGQTCSAAKPGVCGVPCTPQTCVAQGFDCGIWSDGCGSSLDCGTCPAGQTCGGGTSPKSGTCGCTPKSCVQQGFACGTQTDGCGNLINCGACATGQACNAGACAGSCNPQSCVQQHFNCGTATDTCGNPLDCGTCPTGQTCNANVCGCVPKTCAQQGFDCGAATDGCGSPIGCGTCPTGQTCGATSPNVCSMGCMPKSCAQQGFNCGAATDGCGSPIGCGTCPAGQTCGAITPNVCGNPGCTGLCLQQQTCPNGGTTSISGAVFAPNGTDPLPGVTVYVPNGGPAPTYGVQPITPGVSCGPCSKDVSGSPLVSTTTAVDGTFKLTNMPVGSNIPIVLQIGRWRRQMVIPTVTACVDNPQPTAGPAQLRLPKTQSEGAIPLMAFVTGSADALECELRKIGIADTEFTDPTVTGRVRFYLGAGSAASGGATISASTPPETMLWGTQAAINAYDMVFFACQGAEYAKSLAQQQVLIDYANAGGRLFATHFSYVWLYDDPPFSMTASWAINGVMPGNQTGYVDMSFPRGMNLAQWLQVVGATTTLGQVPLTTLRHDFTGVVAPSLRWLTINDATAGTVPVQYTFDTPIGVQPASQCGRVLYNDYHIETAAAGPMGVTFPAECTAGAMTPEEKLVEYAIFDLGGCVGP